MFCCFFKVGSLDKHLWKRFVTIVELTSDLDEADQGSHAKYVINKVLVTYL